MPADSARPEFRVDFPGPVQRHVMAHAPKDYFRIVHGLTRRLSRDPYAGPAHELPPFAGARLLDVGYKSLGGTVWSLAVFYQVAETELRVRILSIMIDEGSES